MRSLRVACCTLALFVVGAGQAWAQQTGFEARGGADWTTFAEEQEYLETLDREQERLSVEQIGVSVEGRPIHLVQVGAVRPQPLEEVARGSSVLFVCSQHGDEPAGREACLQLMRELATTDDPELLAGLAETTVLFIPTANPDGRVANTRRNANDVDINRDHLAYETPEGRAIGRTIRDWNPDLVHDLHEFGSRPGVYDSQFLYLWPRNRNVDDAVHDLSVLLNTEYVKEGVEAAGFSTGVYGIWTQDGKPIAQVAGGPDERILRNSAGLRHSLAILVESNEDPTTPEEEADARVLNNRRVNSHVQGVQDSLRFLREHGAQVELATRRAPIRKALEGKLQSAPVYFAGADNELPPASGLDITPPCRYDLTAEQAAAVEDVLDLHDIRALPLAGGGLTVPMGQASEPFIPLLFDERAQHEVLGASAVDDCAGAAPGL